MTYTFDYISPELRNIIEPASKQNHLSIIDLKSRVFHNSYVAPYIGWKKSIGCLIDSDGGSIKDSECIEWKEDAECYDLQSAVFESKTVIYLGFILSVFGHAFTDNIRKIWFLDTDYCKDLINHGAEFVYTTNKNEPLPSFIHHAFSLAGFSLSNARHIKDLTQFKCIVVPDNCIVAGKYGRLYTREYCDIIAKISKLFIGPTHLKYDKVYFSRTQLHLNKEYGEQVIEREFKKEGYTIVSPEQLPISDQIKIIKNCSCFATTEGSISHLSLFCKPKTRVILINKANYLNYHQIMINEFADVNVTYIEANHSTRVHKDCPWWGPFYLCITPYFEHFLKRKVLHLPYWIRFSYWKYTKNILYRGYNRSRKAIRWMLS